MSGRTNKAVFEGGYRKGNEYWRRINKKLREARAPTIEECKRRGLEIIIIPKHTRCIRKYVGPKKKKEGCKECGARTRAGTLCKRVICDPLKRCPAHRKSKRTAKSRRTSRPKPKRTSKRTKRRYNLRSKVPGK